MRKLPRPNRYHSQYSSSRPSPRTIGNRGWCPGFHPSSQVLPSPGWGNRYSVHFARSKRRLRYLLSRQKWGDGIYGRKTGGLGWGEDAFSFNNQIFRLSKDTVYGTVELRTRRNRSCPGLCRSIDCLVEIIAIGIELILRSISDYTHPVHLACSHQDGCILGGVNQFGGSAAVGIYEVVSSVARQPIQVTSIIMGARNRTP